MARRILQSTAVVTAQVSRIAVGERGSGLRRSFGCSPARRKRVQLSLFHLHDRAAPRSGLARLAAFGWIAF